ncbi:MAG: SpoIID/LytB domain-containing protein [Lachnospiraceae bacterium]|nr:SpoIID/LytB domain-containing protein [Lachnospiraceae bacterium]
MYDKIAERKAIRTVRRKKIQDLLAVLFFLLLLPYTCSVLSGIRQEEAVETFGNGQTGTDAANETFILWEKENGTWKLTEEEFLIGALAASMPAEYRTETLKAQAVILRSICYAKKENDGKLLWEDCQLECLETQQRRTLWGEDFEENEARFQKAVKETDKMVLTYENQLISPPFFRLSAGKTRSGAEIFGEERIVWCHSVECADDQQAELFLQEKEISRSSFIKKLAEAGMVLPDAGAKVVLTRDSAGYVVSVQCSDSQMEGEKFRRLFDLPSSCFFLKEEGGKIILQTKGIGHGLGFDQYSADLLAAEGKSYEELLNYFFAGTSLEKME